MTDSNNTNKAMTLVSKEVSTLVNELENLVADKETQFKTIVPDASSKEGYQFCKGVRGEVLPIKTSVENARKQLKDPVLKMGSLIDSSFKPLVARLEEVYKPFEKAYRDEDKARKQAAEKRRQEIQANFDKISGFALEAMGQTSTVIESMIESLADFDLNPELFGNRHEEALRLHAEVMEKLGGMLTQAIQSEEYQKQIAQQPQVVVSNDDQITGVFVSGSISTISSGYEPLALWPSDSDRAENEWINALCEKLEEAENHIEKLLLARAA